MNRNQQENHGPQRKASETPQPEASRERHRQRRTDSAGKAVQPDERTPEQREALRHPPAQESERQDFEGDDVRTGRPRTR